jgi:isomerase DpgB
VVTPAADLTIRIDGRQPVSAALVTALGSLCDRAEDQAGQAVVTLHVSGAPGALDAGGLTVALVSKWERQLRRLERLPVATLAAAEGDCGGTALDALLTADYRVAARSARLVLPVQAGAAWPGMALYRLAQQAGIAAVRRAVLFGVPLTAADALAAHLVDELADDYAQALAQVAGKAAALAGAELAVRRQLLLSAPDTSFEEALGLHLAACDRTLRWTRAEVVS